MVFTGFSKNPRVFTEISQRFPLKTPRILFIFFFVEIPRVFTGVFVKTLGLTRVLSGSLQNPYDLTKFFIKTLAFS